MAALFKCPPPWCKSGAVACNGGWGPPLHLSSTACARLVNAPSKLPAARVGEVAVFPATQIAVAIGEVEAFPNPLAHAGIEVGREKLVGRSDLVLDLDQLGGLGQIGLHRFLLRLGK